MNFVDKAERRGLISIQPVKALPASPEDETRTLGFPLFL
jgi:hypothetical protein